MDERVLAEISGFEAVSVLCYLLFNCIVTASGGSGVHKHLAYLYAFARSVPLPGEPGTPNPFPSDFGFRPSFGFRISGFGFKPAFA